MRSPMHIKLFQRGFPDEEVALVVYMIHCCGVACADTIAMFVHSICIILTVIWIVNILQVNQTASAAF